MDGKNSSNEKRKPNKPTPDSGKGELQREPSKALSFVSDGNFEELLALAQCDTCGQPVHLHECKPKPPNLKENAADKEGASAGLLEKDNIAKGQQKRDSGSIVLLQPNAKRLATEGKIIQEQSGGASSGGVKVSQKSPIEAKPDTPKQPPSTFDDSYHQLLSLGQCSHCDKPIHPGPCEEGKTSAVGNNMQLKRQDEGTIAPKDKDGKRGSGCHHADHSKGPNNTNPQSSDIETKSNKFDPSFSDNANPIQEVSKEEKKIPADARLPLETTLDSHDSTQYSLDTIDVHNESVSVQTSSFQSPQASVVSKVAPVPESNAVTDTSNNTENDTPMPGKESNEAKVLPLPEKAELLFSNIKVPTDFSTSDIASIENVPPTNDNNVPDQTSTDKQDLETQPQISQSLPSTIQSISITSEDVSELINTTLTSAQAKNSSGHEECPLPPEAPKGQGGSLALDHKENIILTESQDNGKVSEEQCIESVEGELGKENDVIMPQENSVAVAAQTLEKTTTTETDLHEKGVMTEKETKEKKRMSETPHEKAVMTEPQKKVFKPEHTEKAIMTESPLNINNGREPEAKDNLHLPMNGGSSGPRTVKQLEDGAETSTNENQTGSDFYNRASIVSWGPNEIFEPVSSRNDRHPNEFSSESDNIIRMMKMRIATAKDKEVKVECLRQSRSTIECTIKTMKPTTEEETSKMRTETTDEVSMQNQDARIQGSRYSEPENDISSSLQSSVQQNTVDSIPDLTNPANNQRQASQPEQDNTVNQNPLSEALPLLAQPSSQDPELTRVPSKFNVSNSENVNPIQKVSKSKEEEESPEGVRFPFKPTVDSQDDSTQYSRQAINVRDESVSAKPSYTQLPEASVVPTNVLRREVESLRVSRPLPHVNPVGVAEPESVQKSQLQPITEEDLSTLAPAEALEIRVAQQQENTLQLPQEQTEMDNPITGSHQLNHLSSEDLWKMENAEFEIDHRMSKKSVESEGEHGLVEVFDENIDESDQADNGPEKLWKMENLKRDTKSLHRISRMTSIQSEGGNERKRSTRAASGSEPEGRGSLSKDYASFHIKKGEGFLGLEYAMPEETISVVTYYESSSGSDQEDEEQLQSGIVEKARQVKDLVSTKRLGLLQVQSDHIIRLANEVITTHHAKSATDVGKSQDEASAWDKRPDLKNIKEKDRVDRFAKNIIQITVESEEILNKLKSTDEFPTPIPRGEAANHLTKMIKKLHCRHKKLRNMAEEIVAKRWKLLNLTSGAELGKKKDEKAQKKKNKSSKSKNVENDQKRKAGELKTLYSNPLARLKQVGVGVSAGQEAWTETDPLWKAIHKVGNEQVEKCIESEKAQAKDIPDNKESTSRRALSDQLRQSVLTILTNNFSKMSAGRLVTNLSPKTSGTAQIFDRNNTTLINKFVDQWKRRCYSIGIMTVIITALLQCLYLSGPRMGDNYMTYTMVDSLSGPPLLCPTGIYGLIFLGYLFGGMAVVKTTSAMGHNETVRDYQRNRKFKIHIWYGLVSYFFIIWIIRIGMWLARMDSIEEEMRSIFQTKFFYHQFGCCGADGPADYSEGDKVGWPKSCYDTVDTYDEYYTEEPQPIEYGCLVAVYKYNAISMAVISGLCLIIWILAVVFPMYLYVYELFICMRARELDPWLEDARDGQATCACHCFRRRTHHPNAPPRDSIDSQDQE